MKSLTVWHGHSTRPSLPVGTARKGKENLLHGRRSRLVMQTTKNRKFPLGNSLLYISFLSVAFGRVRPGGRTLFLFYTLIEKNFVSYCKSLYIFSYCSIQTFAASIPQSSRFMDRALIHPKKFMKVI